MKSYFHFYSVIILLLLLSALLNAQVPNGSFEEWSTEPKSEILMPDNWTFGALPGIAIPVTPCSASHSGQLAVRGEVLETGLPFPNELLTPYLVSLPYGSTDYGFPVTQRFTELSGFYQFKPEGRDRFHIVVNMFRDSIAVGAGCITYLDSATAFLPFTVNIDYLSDITPNFCLISIIINPPEGMYTVHSGSYFILDDLSLGGTVSVQDKEKISELPEKIILNQNYPNPFNLSTTIRYQLPDYSDIALKVFDLTGREVKTLVNQKKAAGTYEVTFDASGLASGIYIYRLITDDCIVSQKLNLLK
ncbi:MAG: T9SS type A sorting domain-containing protein [bacterium]